MQEPWKVLEQVLQKELPEEDHQAFLAHLEQKALREKDLVVVRAARICLDNRSSMKKPQGA
jgi:hypothetical protein